jgi:hypothetical protein
VECWDWQTYPKERRRLLIYNTGGEFTLDIRNVEGWDLVLDPPNGRSIGSLRNAAIECSYKSDLERGTQHVIVHWDDDDWSHPNRLEEQVSLLVSSGAQLVGYNDMLYWDTATNPEEPQVWYYTASHPDTCVGTSMCYWRAAWERRPFTTRNTPEDTEWQVHVKERKAVPVGPYVKGRFLDARMIAHMHEKGTSTSSLLTGRGPANWTRMQHLDAVKTVRELMEVPRA